MSLLRDRVKGRVKFQLYTQGELWYTTDDGFDFPVSISDTGNGTFLAEDKAILFMKYIRKHMEMLEKAKQEAGIDSGRKMDE
jgi:hypothetical protein